MLKRIVKLIPGIKAPRRLRIVSRYLSKPLRSSFLWLFQNTEESNFYYDLSDLNYDQLIQGTSLALGLRYEEVSTYFDELRFDDNLKEVIRKNLVQSGEPSGIQVAFGRRAVWYAFVRGLKPGLVVETGVSHGVGSCVIASALLKNASEGFPGRYLGTDIDQKAGVVFSPPYSHTGEILYGDSIESLRQLNTPIDLFINDSDHDKYYEYNEYRVIKEKLAPGAVILSDNAHVSDSLSKFSREFSRKYFYMHEFPRGHWYPGAGIGVSLES